MKYAIEGITKQSTIDYIEGSPVKKLIYELNYKYGLKALTVITIERRGGEDIRNEVVLTDPMGGFAVGRVWTTVDNKDIVYHYRSPYASKDRGRTSEDRETYYGKKLSSLMSVLKTNGVIPTKDSPQLLTIHNRIFTNANYSLQETHGKHRKDVELTLDEQHSLLRYALGETTTLFDENKCKKILDKYNTLDKIKQESDEDVDRFFNKGFYAVGVDMFNHLIVGKVVKNKSSYEIVESFERVMDFSKHEHLQAIMTMQKVYHEQQGKYTKFYGNYIPLYSGYLKDLDIIQMNIREPHIHDLAWTLIPCTALSV